jgi:hypothetical protein
METVSCIVPVICLAEALDVRGVLGVTLTQSRILLALKSSNLW